MLKEQRIVGILGGMGPLAGVDMLSKLIDATHAGSDQEHVPVILSSIPNVPDRSQFLLQGGEDPFPYLLAYAQNLVNAGAKCLIIACNTAHFWFERLQSALPEVQMFSMIEACCAQVAASGAQHIGILATSATLQTQLYKRHIQSLGLTYHEPQQQEQVMQSIYLYKAGKHVQAHALMTAAAAQLLDAGAESLIMGCTEVPLILAQESKANPRQYVDATQALVNRTLQWYQQG